MIVGDDTMTDQSDDSDDGHHTKEQTTEQDEALALRRPFLYHFQDRGEHSCLLIITSEERSRD